MILRKKPHALQNKAAKRLTKLHSQEVLSWTDLVGTGIAKSLEDFRRAKTEEERQAAIKTAEEGLHMLAGAVYVLNHRTMNG